jgi:diguanylate cyclase (GGDEF)-like protein
VDGAIEFYAPESAHLLVETFRRALATGAPYDLELELERADGERIWVRTIGRPIIEDGAVVRVTGSIMDVTGRSMTNRLLAAPSEILEILASPIQVTQIVEGIVATLKQATGLDAVGLRLREEDDYPFAAAIGYSAEFLQAENALVVRFPDGGLCRDEAGSLSLECTCGLVLSGGTDPANSLFTLGGSAVTNDATSVLELSPEDDPRLNPRNRCIHVGFQSIALVPLRAGEEIIGLLHLADRRKDRFTPEAVRFLEGVGASIAIALQHRRAEDQIHRQNEELLRLNDELAARAAALEEANATISRIAATDDLTGLANRRHFYETLEKAVSLARRHDGPLALVSLDLDGLKEVNDSAGHAAGDAVLRSFATLLGGLCRTEDLAARLGGDEFGLLLPGIDLAGARGLAERVLEAVRACESLTRRDVTASAGVADRRTAESPDDLLRRADEALYAAKRGGGDTVEDAD